MAKKIKRTENLFTKNDEKLVPLIPKNLLGGHHIPKFSVISEVTIFSTAFLIMLGLIGIFTGIFKIY